MGDNQIYRTLREDSPISDVSSTQSGTSNHRVQLIPNDLSSANEKQETNKSTPNISFINSSSTSSSSNRNQHHNKKQYDSRKQQINKDRRRNNMPGGILPLIHQHPQHQHQQQQQQSNQSSVGIQPLSLESPTQPTTSIECHSYSLCSTPPPSIKTQSLPLNSSLNDLDTIILSALRISPEDLAGQITLLDFPAFESIEPDELTSCGWTKKDKYTVAPNIVAFTRRFNHTSFWTIQEILNGPTPKKRAEIMTHFIRVSVWHGMNIRKLITNQINVLHFPFFSFFIDLGSQKIT